MPFAAAVFGFLGVTGGEVERILRNFLPEFLIAFFLVLLAAVIGSLLPALQDVLSAGVRLILLFVGSVLLLAGLVWLADLAARSGTENERPQISTILERKNQRSVLSAEVSGAGLKATEHLVVTVTGQTAASEGRLLYGARVGPDVDGDVTHSLQIPLRIGRYSAIDLHAELFTSSPESLRAFAAPSSDKRRCNDESRLLACVTLFPDKSRGDDRQDAE
ncbi:MAG: hypothetical protein AABM66_07175 [Actinomycetota bacterium]